MFIYQLQDRVLVFESDKVRQFPNTVILNVILAPLEAFGVSDAPSRLIIRNHLVNFTFDPNCGRTYLQSTPPLQPLDIVYDSPTKQVRFSLKGNVFNVQAEIENAEQLNEYLVKVLYIFPPLLNLYFADPPIVKEITGLLGDDHFRVQHRETTYLTKSVELNELYRDIFRVFMRLGEMRNQARLTTALNYFHVASRLLVVGASQWEFMAEIVLQMCKILQVLFGNDRADVRQGLPQLGYSTEEIERDFITMMLLRDDFDIAHPGIAIPDPVQLQFLYKYLARSEVIYRDLFIRIIDAIENGRFALRPLNQSKLDSKAQRTFNQIIENIKSVV